MGTLSPLYSVTLYPVYHSCIESYCKKEQEHPATAICSKLFCAELERLFSLNKLLSFTKVFLIYLQRFFVAGALVAQDEEGLNPTL